jgi:hypothetical protein
MYKVSSVDFFSRDACKDIMKEIYEEEPSYWPNGLSMGHHDDVYLVREKKANKPVGFVGFQKIADNTGKLTGYYTIGILKDYRNQGFAKEAVQTMLEEKHPEVAEVKALIMEHNEPSLELAKSLDVDTRIKQAFFSLSNKTMEDTLATKRADTFLNKALASADNALAKNQEMIDARLEEEKVQAEQEAAQELQREEQEMRKAEFLHKEEDRTEKQRDKEERRIEKEEKRQEKAQKQISDATKAHYEQQEAQAESEVQQAEEDEQKILMEKEEDDSRLPKSLQRINTSGNMAGVKLTGNNSIYSGLPGSNVQIQDDAGNTAPEAEDAPAGQAEATKKAHWLKKEAGPLSSIWKGIKGSAPTVTGGLGGLGLGHLETEGIRQYFGGDANPYTGKLNPLLGAVVGAMMGNRFGKVLPTGKLGPAELFANTWVPKSLLIGGTDVAMRMAEQQASLASKGVDAARAQENAAKILAASILGVGGLGAGYGGYKMYENKQKEKAKKERAAKKKERETVKGKPNRRRQKVRIDVPAESLPPEFFESLIDSDDAQDAAMSVPTEMLDQQPLPKAAGIYKDTNFFFEKKANTFLDRAQGFAEGWKGFPYKVPSHLKGHSSITPSPGRYQFQENSTSPRNIMSAGLNYLDQSFLKPYHGVLKDWGIMSPSKMETVSGGGNPWNEYDFTHEAGRRALLGQLNKMRTSNPMRPGMPTSMTSPIAHNPLHLA